MFSGPGRRFVVAALATVLVAGCASASSGDELDASPDGSTDAAFDAGPDAPPDACVASAEQCNQADDDCDDEVDEDFTDLGDACAVGIGACAATGQIQCDEDGTTACSAVPGVPADSDPCDGFDNDCDGDTDEGFAVGTLCDGVDSDACAEGMIMCDGNGGAVCGDVTGDSIEVCNETDDDCDLATDEGLGKGDPCDGLDTDVCVEGQKVCAPDGGLTCSDVSSSTVEICNHLDDDCTDGIDNGFAVNQTCNVGIGACARTGVTDCNGAGTGVVCSVSAGTPGAETCGDSIDQDCNGADPTCPGNDRATGAIDVSAGGTFTADLVAARDDNFAAGCGGSGGRDLFYTLTLPAPEVVYFDTFGSTFDSVLRIFPGACTSPGAITACSDDATRCQLFQSQVALQLATGQHCVVVDQFNGQETAGASVLHVTRGRRVGSLIATQNGSVTDTTVGRANQTSPAATCQSLTTAPDFGHFFTTCPGETRAVTASTCTGTTFDSIVYLRRGAANTADAACNDDSCGLQSNMINGTVSGGSLNWFIVDGFDTQSGAYTLTYTIQ